MILTGHQVLIQACQDLSMVRKMVMPLQTSARAPCPLPHRDFSASRYFNCMYHAVSTACAASHPPDQCCASLDKGFKRFRGAAESTSPPSVCVCVFVAVWRGASMCPAPKSSAAVTEPYHHTHTPQCYHHTCCFTPCTVF